MTNNECCTKECCKIDAVISVDAKGQIVLPKDLREKAKIKPNDKLAVIGFQKDSEVCCIVMLKVDALETTVKNLLGPVFKNVFQPEEKNNETRKNP
ncbi:MAG: AbrB/MazE/SpoVT family DNA-binding domain-containing protein [Chloroflexi bacterium]|nr:AbrB/MazE/SpoVT family DNA-binding domain-containing protein [Chloroflexota bacterium]